MLSIAIIYLFISLVSTLDQGLWSRTTRLPNGGLTRREASTNASDYKALTIDIPIDHYNASDHRTYSNRYWMNSTYYKKGGPVFYFDTGEQNAHPTVPYYLAEASGPSAIMALARRFGGLAVLFEHRFYGDLHEGSFPFPVNATSGMAEGGYEAYRYLNTEQALQDPVYFAHNFKPPGLEQYWNSFAPDRTPWIWLGGSYPGVRGADIRVRNPETFFATWASSAPTQAAVDMYVYYVPAEKSMTRNCSADYTAITKWVDSVLSDGTAQQISDLKYDLYKAIQAGPGGQTTSVNKSDSDSLTNQQVGGMLQTPLSFYQYYGFQDSVLPFCDIMETQNRTTARTQDNGGIAPPFATEGGLQMTYNNISLTWSAFLTGIAEIDYDSIPYNDDPIADKSWMWQYCSEVP